MEILKLNPVFKDYIWGGTRLHTDYGFNTGFDKTAEGWMLVCHKDGVNTVDGGEFDKMPLDKVIDQVGLEAIGGKNCLKFPYFPVLIKLIDAKDNLSVQVHPNDEYALRVEGEFGKTEMWYVVDHEPGAGIYYGFKHEITKEEFRRRIGDNTLTEVLNFVPVETGKTYFIESGTIHAIGKGILIAEIQQNSNTTYRVSDYGRLGADGKPRPLHIEKAVEVTRLAPPRPHIPQNKALLADCKYFKVRLLQMQSGAELNVDGGSFSSILCLEGQAELGGVHLEKGDCAFIPAGFGSVQLLGSGKFIESRV